MAPTVDPTSPAAHQEESIWADIARLDRSSLDLQKSVLSLANNMNDRLDRNSVVMREMNEMLAQMNKNLCYLLGIEEPGENPAATVGMIPTATDPAPEAQAKARNEGILLTPTLETSHQVLPVETQIAPPVQKQNPGNSVRNLIEHLEGDSIDGSVRRESAPADGVTGNKVWMPRGIELDQLYYKVRKKRKRNVVERNRVESLDGLELRHLKVERAKMKKKNRVKPKRVFEQEFQRLNGIGGKSIKVMGLSPKLLIQIQDVFILEAFLILDTGGSDYDLILGYDWLECLGETAINWKEGSLSYEIAALGMTFEIGAETTSTLAEEALGQKKKGMEELNSDGTVKGIEKKELCEPHNEFKSMSGYLWLSYFRSLLVSSTNLDSRAQLTVLIHGNPLMFDDSAETQTEGSHLLKEMLKLDNEVSGLEHTFPIPFKIGEKRIQGVATFDIVKFFEGNKVWEPGVMMMNEICDAVVKKRTAGNQVLSIFESEANSDIIENVVTTLLELSRELQGFCDVYGITIEGARVGDVEREVAGHDSEASQIWCRYSLDILCPESPYAVYPESNFSVKKKGKKLMVWITHYAGSISEMAGAVMVLLGYLVMPSLLLVGFFLVVKTLSGVEIILNSSESKTLLIGAGYQEGKRNPRGIGAWHSENKKPQEHGAWYDENKKRIITDVHAYSLASGLFNLEDKVA